MRGLTMHYYQFNIGDYTSHTRGLSLMEDLAYRRIMDEYYLHERPLNGCSTDVARVIGMTEYESAVDYILHRFFYENDGYWMHDRIENELKTYENKRNAASKAGKKSGERRRKNKNIEQNNENSSTNIERSLNEPSTNQEPRTNNQELKESKTNVLLVASAADNCPHQEIINLYHEILPMCPTVRQWTPARQKFLRQRWKEDPERQDIAWWRKFFSYVAKSDYLTGKTDNHPGKPPYTADLEWIVRPNNFVKIYEGKYHHAA